MIKRMFFGLALFVALFTILAWQFAVAELAELQSQPQIQIEESTAEVPQ